MIIAVKGGGINLNIIHKKFCTLRESLFGKNNSKRGGVPIAIPEAKSVITIVVVISLSRGSELKASINSMNEGKINDVYLNGVNISKSSLYSQLNPIDSDSINIEIIVNG